LECSGTTSGTPANDAEANWANAFNGLITGQGTACAGNSTYSLTFPSVLNGVTKVEAYLGGAANDSFIILNGNTAQKVGITTNGGQWIDVTAALNGDNTLSAVGINATGGGGTAQLYALKVNDAFLVDQGSFGASGFYLPFDPEATGISYSSDITTTNGPFIDGSSCFDSNLASFGATENNGATASFPSVAAIPTGLLEIYALSNSQGCTVYFDDGPVATLPPNVSQWTVCGNLDDIGKVSIGCAGTMNIAGFRVNGEILVDHNSIGCDASGNENNFHDQNFAVGNTSQVWSANANNNFATAAPAYAMFNGSTNSSGGTNRSYASTEDSTATATFDSIAVNEKLEVYLDSGVTQPGLLYINGNLIPNITKELNLSWITIPGISTLTSVGVGRDDAGEYGDYTAIYAVRVDGKILVDANIQDTVTDTPLMAYAVLEGNTHNGGLLSDSVTGFDQYTSYRGEVGTTYYYEIIAGQPAAGYLLNGGDPVTLFGNSTYNFGQQPFAASNVIYDQATGTVEIPGAVQPYDSRANTSQVWSNGTLTGATTPLQYLYDGNSSTFVNNNASNPPTQIVVTLPVQVPVNTSLRFYGNVESAAPPEYLIEATYSDDTTERLVTSNTGFGWYEITVEIDGRLLVDQGVWNNSQNWSDNYASATGFEASGPAVNAFDGSTSTSANPANDGSSTFTIPAGITSASFSAVGVGGTSAKINSGSEVSIGNGVGGSLAAVGTVSSGDVVTFARSSGTASVYAMALDGAILVDSGAQWNTSQVWSDYGTGNTGSGGEWANAFDGSLSSISFPASGTLTWTPPSGIPFTTLQIAGYKDTSPGTLKINGVDVTSQLSNSPISTVTITGVTSPLTSIESISNAPTANIGLAAVIVDDEILVDPTGGTYSTLFQTWEQTKAALLKTAAELGYDYAEVLLAIARPWTLGDVYNTNDLIKYNCRVYRALQDSITSYLPTSTNTAYWEDINLECDPTAHPGLMDLIPDDWTDEQRQAALQELLAELNAQTTPN
jgi:hypothetical protein